MEKTHNYVTCQSCEWQLANFPDRDWSSSPCFMCNNTRQVIDPREILCNLCGGCMCPIGTHNEQHPHGLVDAEVTGGYEIPMILVEQTMKMMNKVKIAGHKTVNVRKIT